MFSGYSYNERSMLSLGIVDPDIQLGNEVKLLWGEEGGGTKKPTVERHKQIEIRARSARCRTRATRAKATSRDGARRRCRRAIRTAGGRARPDAGASRAVRPVPSDAADRRTIASQ